MDLDEILKQVPIDDIAEKFGVSRDVAQQAVQEGGAALLGGLAKNAETSEGSAAIEQALSKHGGFSGVASVDDVDQADGEKIVTHVFGGNSANVAETLTNEPKTAGIDFGKLLPILAPIVMGIVANLGKGKAAPADGGTAGGDAESGGGIGDLIGGLFGGGNGGSGGGGLGDVLGGLGGLLGGSNAGGGGGGIDIGGLLGGLFGGKK
ncbi:hypothetical protein J2Y69_001151 [Microbacterium resistens]|uniref:DUF937 domain-containing protein n=1 Tax=Microbacterium resistens TaxID=156977 RepID=A0ABU1SCB6_9MICO|nr:DUF937 domain-containing protein [Microbacterium resistens]MDR6866558.1 hypothetical protein [Microbacterium resistens]